MWTYILAERIDVVPLYFAAERPMVDRDGTLIVVDDERMRFEPGERPVEPPGALPLARLLPAVRRRRVPPPPRSRRSSPRCAPPRVSERAGRLIDQDQDASMEAKKREGYF